MSPRETSHGSSPRVRGTSYYRFLVSVISRFIPARAGNIHCPLLVALENTVHPRECGEHLVSVGMAISYFGSSPRVRGTSCASPTPTRLLRFIPARAGNIIVVIFFSFFTPVHPRACGEHFLNNVPAPKGNGSSPRVRGTLECVIFVSVHCRFIPARAGNMRHLLRLSAI